MGRSGVRRAVLVAGLWAGVAALALPVSGQDAEHPGSPESAAGMLADNLVRQMLGEFDAHGLRVALEPLRPAQFPGLNEQQRRQLYDLLMDGLRSEASGKYEMVNPSRFEPLSRTLEGTAGTDWFDRYLGIVRAAGAQISISCRASPARQGRFTLSCSAEAVDPYRYLAAEQQEFETDWPTGPVDAASVPHVSGRDAEWSGDPERAAGRLAEDLLTKVRCLSDANGRLLALEPLPPDPFLDLGERQRRQLHDLLWGSLRSAAEGGYTMLNPSLFEFFSRVLKEKRGKGFDWFPTIAADAGAQIGISCRGGPARQGRFMLSCSADAVEPYRYLVSAQREFETEWMSGPVEPPTGPHVSGRDAEWSGDPEHAAGLLADDLVGRMRCHSHSRGQMVALEPLRPDRFLDLDEHRRRQLYDLLWGSLHSAAEGRYTMVNPSLFESCSRRLEETRRNGFDRCRRIVEESGVQIRISCQAGPARQGRFMLSCSARSVYPYRNLVSAQREFERDWMPESVEAVEANP